MNTAVAAGREEGSRDGPLLLAAGVHHRRVIVTLVVMRTGIRLVPPEGVRTGTERVIVRVLVRRTIYFPRLGAACESADPAAVLDVLDVRPSRSTLLAARAAVRLVRRDMRLLLVQGLPLCSPQEGL